MISHVALIVSELEASESFYLTLLKPLGFRKADSASGQYTRLTNGVDAVIVLSPVACDYEDTRFHRRAVGLNHIALCAPSREVIAQVVATMTENGISPMGDGRVDTGYRGDYDTVSYEDPDRIMVEIVFHGPAYFAHGSENLFP